jgi:uncharacterized protein (TIGR02246 family)
MKTRLLGALVGLAISLALPTFGQQKETVDPKIDQQIRMLAMKYDAAINNHDAAAIAALYTQDAVLATYNKGTFHGRQKIEKAYAEDYFMRWNIHNNATTVSRVTPVGNEVRATGTWSNYYQETTKGDLRPDSGSYSWVVVREGDTWKIRRDSQSGAMGNPS